MISRFKKYVFSLMLGLLLFWSNTAMALTLNMGASEGRCDIPQIIEKYTQHCFSCATVSTIVSVFLEVGADAYPLMRSAGNTLLMILSALWIALFLLKNLSQFNAVELPDFIQQFSIFLFKVLVAFVCLNGGIGFILDYTLNPIISFGTDMGIGILSLTGDVSSAADYLNLLDNLNGMEVSYA